MKREVFRWKTWTELRVDKRGSQGRGEEKGERARSSEVLHAPHRVGVESCYCAWDLVLYK